VTGEVSGDGAVTDDEPVVEREELRQVEARFAARFQAVSARFTTTDRRFAGLGERVEALELHARTVDERSVARDKTVDGRFDATDARIDLIYDQLAVKVDAASRRHGRLFVYAVVAVGAGVAVVEAVVLTAWSWLT
jgi:hypothetical protein